MVAFVVGSFIVAYLTVVKRLSTGMQHYHSHASKQVQNITCSSIIKTTKFKKIIVKHL
jgi:hypothetical protein